MPRKQQRTAAEIQPLPWEPDPKDFMSRFERPEHEQRPPTPPHAGAGATADRAEAGSELGAGVGPDTDWGPETDWELEGGLEADDDRDDDHLSDAELEEAARLYAQIYGNAARSGGTVQRADSSVGANSPGRGMPGEGSRGTGAAASSARVGALGGGVSAGGVSAGQRGDERRSAAGPSRTMAYRERRPDAQGNRQVIGPEARPAAPFAGAGVGIGGLAGAGASAAEGDGVSAKAAAGRPQAVVPQAVARQAPMPKATVPPAPVPQAAGHPPAAEGPPRVVVPRSGMLVCAHPDNVGLFKTRWYDELEARPRSERSWVWRGFLAHRSVTLLSSQWKAGKTTLVSVLLSRLKHGGELAGQPVAAGKAVVVSEEPEELWRERGAELGFGPHLCFICQPFVSAPTEINWRGLIERLWELHKTAGVGLAVLDTLTGLGPAGCESNAAAAMEALRPLGSLARQGLSLLLLHHPRKGHAAAGEAARGSGALCSFVDILMEMRRPSGNQHDRRRKLWACSRYHETPRELLIELNAAGTDYALLDWESTEYAEAWEQVAMILSSPPRELSREEILQEWPPDARRPSKTGMWNWLERAVAEGRARRTGSGRRNDAFRYAVAGEEAEKDEGGCAKSASRRRGGGGEAEKDEGGRGKEARGRTRGRKSRNEERGTGNGELGTGEAVKDEGGGAKAASHRHGETAEVLALGGELPLVVA